MATAARTWALTGKRDTALSALEQALANGWNYVTDMDDSSLADIGDEPAYRGLRGNARFETLRSRINNNLTRERAEISADLSAKHPN